MSYGVIGTKSATLLVETTTGAGGSDADAVLDRFAQGYGAVWVGGRVTLTPRHLSFVPTRPVRGLAIVELHLRDVAGVEISGGRLTHVIGIRTAGHVVRLRVGGAPAFAGAVARGAEDLRPLAAR
jgi:hypothetical protein